MKKIYMHERISFQSAFNGLSAANNRGTICMDFGLPPNQSSQGATNLEVTKTTVICVCLGKQAMLYT